VEFQMPVVAATLRVSRPAPPRGRAGRGGAWPRHAGSWTTFPAPNGDRGAHGHGSAVRRVRLTPHAQLPELQKSGLPLARPPEIGLAPRASCRWTVGSAAGAVLSPSYACSCWGPGRLELCLLTCLRVLTV
jgi:hypothetical protein